MGWCRKKRWQKSPERYSVGRSPSSEDSGYNRNRNRPVKLAGRVYFLARYLPGLTPNTCLTAQDRE